MAETKVKTNQEVEKKVEQTKKQPKTKSKLSGKQKFLYIFLCIITFSIIYWVVRAKVNQAKHQPFDQSAEPTSDTSKQLKTAKKVDIDVDKLIEALGTRQNILTVEASLNSLKVGIKDKSKVKQDVIKSLGAKGLMISGLKVSIVFGDMSIPLKDILEEKLGF